MSDTNSRKLKSFAEAEGRVPKLFKWGELSESLRARLFDLFWNVLNANLDPTGVAGYSRLAGPFRSLLYDEWVLRRHNAADEFRDFDAPKKLAAGYKDIFFNGDYIEVLDLVTFLARNRHRPAQLDEAFKAVIDEAGPYLALLNPFTIVPASVPEERQLVSEALSEIARSPYEGAKAHFTSAAAQLNANDPAGAVRESIHAVESAAKVIAQKPGATLLDALAQLRKDGVHIHAQFEQAIKNLYNYTSDEKGVRHALLNEPTKVDFNEAIFMYQACIALVAYFDRLVPR